MVETNNSPGTLAESGGGLGSSRVRTGFPQNFTNSSLNPLKKNNSLTKSNLTSTWNVGTSISNEYISEKNSNFTNPRLKSNLSTHISQQDIKKLQHEDQREKMRNQAYEKFEKLAKKKYGSVEGLFAAV